MTDTTPSALVMLAASAGGLAALQKVLHDLPPAVPAPVVIVLHRTPRHRSHLCEILSRATSLPVRDAAPGTRLQAGTVYISRPDVQLTVTDDGRLAERDRRVRLVPSSANPLFESAGAAFGRGSVGVALMGMDADGTAGVHALKSHGGVVIAHDTRREEQSGLPSSDRADSVDHFLPLEEIAPALARLVGARTPPSTAESPGA
jgi:two-component system chemotaxis response regulator CheB